MADDAEPEFRLTCSGKGIVSTLLTVKAPPKQVCSLTVERRGLTVRWDDGSASAQCGVFVPGDLFSTFSAPADGVEVGAAFGPLVEALSLCSTGADDAEVELSYPGPDAELVVRAGWERGEGKRPPGAPGREGDRADGEGGEDGPADAPLLPTPVFASHTSTFVLVSTREAPEARDLGEHWAEPGGGAFIAPAQLLREAAEDLEWAGGDAGVLLLRDPPVAVLHAGAGAAPLRHRRTAGGVGGGLGGGLGSGDGGVSGGKAVRVELPAEKIVGFQCAGTSVSWRYSYKALRAALGNLPSARIADCSTKVAIDAGGMLRVTHMLGPGGLERGGGGRRAAHRPAEDRRRQ